MYNKIQVKQFEYAQFEFSYIMMQQLYHFTFYILIFDNYK